MKSDNRVLLCILVFSFLFLSLIYVKRHLPSSKPPVRYVPLPPVVVSPTVARAYNPHLIFALYSVEGLNSSREYVEYDLITHRVTALTAGHPFYKRTLKRTPPDYVPDEYVRHIFKLPASTPILQIRDTMQSDGSFIVRTQSDDKKIYWGYKQNDGEYSSLFTSEDTTCEGYIKGWNKEEQKVFIEMTKQSLIDSSSDDVSGVCIFDYGTKKVIYKTTVPMTTTVSYYGTVPTADMTRVVVQGNNRMLILDTTSQKQVVIEGSALYDSEKTIETRGTIVLVSDKESAYELSLYDVYTNQYLSKVMVEKNAFNGKEGSYIHLDDATFDIDTDLYYVGFNAYAPYTTCWYSFGSSEELKKLACANDIYQQFYPGKKTDAFRADLVSYFDGQQYK